ncbi:hypothetical protein [Zhihengliuella halotolerans]|uniref:AAA domain-containing protein n=1 Tax=Zhihengliuella halotolerans TaxID=370736 RepID=A0A4Q8ACF5_9MICC|nr:hypothetical protein [Zhihengliuella halotolerans]RZU61754.1 hypothetical protein EV380_1332 [Zhihengliuella halotolerans]
MTRRVVLLCGPAGAGKTTAARASGLRVFDRDDPDWSTDAEFNEAIASLREERDTQAVVIRAGATSSARAKTRRLIGATEVYVVLQPREVLARRIHHRGRADARHTLAALNAWFRSFDRDDGVELFTGWADDTVALGVIGTVW